MPDFTNNVEQAVHRALHEASLLNQEYSTIEHLLYALTYERSAVEAIFACGSDVKLLRKNLKNYLETELSNLLREDSKFGNEPKPTAGFQRVIQRAVIHVQSSGKNLVEGANLLVAVFAERESHAAYFLQEQDLTRYDIVNFINHRIVKADNFLDLTDDLLGSDPSIEIETKPFSDHEIFPGVSSGRSESKEKKPDFETRAVRRVNKKVSADKDFAASLAISLARLAELELRELNNHRPNSKEGLDAKAAQVELLNIFFEGFTKIAETLARSNSTSRDNKSTTLAASKKVVHLSDAINEWWCKNNQKVVNFAVASPVTVGAFATMKALGAETYMQAAATSAVASIWFGPNVVKNALVVMKNFKRK